MTKQEIIDGLKKINPDCFMGDNTYYLILSAISLLEAKDKYQIINDFSRSKESDIKGFEAKEEKQSREILTPDLPQKIEEIELFQELYEDLSTKDAFMKIDELVQNQNKITRVVNVITNHLLHKEMK